ncbi:hypothetical protein [Brevibacterium casei]
MSFEDRFVEIASNITEDMCERLELPENGDNIPGQLREISFDQLVKLTGEAVVAVNELVLALLAEDLKLNRDRSRKVEEGVDRLHAALRYTTFVLKGDAPDDASGLFS